MVKSFIIIISWIINWIELKGSLKYYVDFGFRAINVFCCCSIRLRLVPSVTRWYDGAIGQLHLVRSAHFTLQYALFLKFT